MRYKIANLEDQLGITLFDRIGTRKPTLTPQGAAILVETRAFGRGIAGLKAKVRGLLQRLEAEVSAAVGIMMPATVLAGVCRAFEAAFPTVALRLHVEALGAVTALVLDGQADFAINGPINGGTETLQVIHKSSNVSS